MKKKNQNESNGRTYGYNNNSNNNNKSVQTYNTFHFACKILVRVKCGFSCLYCCNCTDSRNHSKLCFYGVLHTTQNML